MSTPEKPKLCTGLLKTHKPHFVNGTYVSSGNIKFPNFWYELLMIRPSKPLEAGQNPAEGASTLCYLFLPALAA